MMDEKVKVKHECFEASIYGIFERISRQMGYTPIAKMGYEPKKLFRINRCIWNEPKICANFANHEPKKFFGISGAWVRCNEIERMNPMQILARPETKARRPLYAFATLREDVFDVHL